MEWKWGSDPREEYPVQVYFQGTESRREQEDLFHHRLTEWTKEWQVGERKWRAVLSFLMGWVAVCVNSWLGWDDFPLETWFLFFFYFFRAIKSGSGSTLSPLIPFPSSLPLFLPSTSNTFPRINFSYFLCNNNNINCLCESFFPFLEKVFDGRFLSLSSTDLIHGRIKKKTTSILKKKSLKKVESGKRNALLLSIHPWILYSLNFFLP